MVTIDLQLRGLVCEACVAIVKKRLASVPGITRASIHRETGLTQIVAARKIELAEIAAVLAPDGYSVSGMQE